MFLSCCCWAGVRVVMPVVLIGPGRDESPELAAALFMKAANSWPAGFCRFWVSCDWGRPSIRGRYWRDWGKEAVGTFQLSGKRFNASKGSPSLGANGGVNWLGSVQAGFAE